MATKEEMLKNRYVISSKPFLYKTEPFESIDIDTNYDFELSKLMYKNKNILKKL